MSKRLVFPDDRQPPSGGGPEDPMLEQRLGRIEQILGRLEPMIVDLARTAVRHADLAALRTETKSEFALLRSETATKSDLAALRTDTKSEFALLRSEMATKDNIAAVHSDIAELKGRMKGVEGHFAYFPTTTQMMAIIATMLIGLTGIIFAAGRYFKP